MLLPDGSSLAIRDSVYPLDDIYCWVNGWYYASYETRKALVNNFTYLEEVSEPFCRSLEESVPNYHRISIDDATDETAHDMKALEQMWAAPGAVAQINQTVVEGMKVHAAFKSLLAQLPPPLPTTRVDDVVARAQLTNYVSILGLGIERQLITAAHVEEVALCQLASADYGILLVAMQARRCQEDGAEEEIPEHDPVVEVELPATTVPPPEVPWPEHALRWALLADLRREA
ncbi:hypothetical protein AK812_SmicGene29241 [Symbiodinium microadriaticum]|uniref:Uncharacterized protein n=1 Tax=Symbiodinium microadriaticum TaxID=2951 RepID=A0A1Q9D2C0_SYMMI|nr:hypothetical protein AK812_SmicGene29241 [Symbiodinium microadriaticum]